MPKNRIKSKNNSDVEYFFSPGYDAKFLKKLNEQRKNDNFSDVILVSGIDQKKVHAHRFILSAASDYFKAMFESSLLESNSKEVVLENIHGDDLNNLVSYCYTGRAAIAEKNSVSLLSAAHMLQLVELVNGCCNFLERQLDASNCIGIALFAEQRNCKHLMEVAKKYIYKYFTEVIKNEEFLKLSKTQIQEILSNDELNIDNEEEAFRSLMKWIDHDVENRKEEIKNLLKFIRLEFVNTKCLFDEIKPICFDNHCENLFVEATRYHLLPESRQMDGVKPRKSYDNTLFILGFRYSCNAVIESYSPKNREWIIKKCGIKLNPNDDGFALIGENLITIGINGTEDVECLNLNTMCSRSLSSLNERRLECGIAVLGTQIYVIGGYNNYGRCSNQRHCLGRVSDAMTSVERLISLNAEWTRVANMNMRRYNCGVTVHEGNIYVIGGKNGNNMDFDGVEFYNPVQNKWFMRANLIHQRSGCAVVSAHGFIYAFGGNNNQSVERYNTKLNTWTVIYTLNEISTLISCAVFGEKIFVITGKFVDTYDFKENRWFEDSNLNGLYDRIFAFSGSQVEIQL